MAKKKLKIGDKINVVLMGIDYGKGTIIEDYDKDQWIVEFEWHVNNYKETVKRYVDKLNNM